MSDESDTRSQGLLFALVAVAVLLVLGGAGVLWWARQTAAIRAERDAVVAEMEAVRANAEAMRAAAEAERLAWKEEFRNRTAAKIEQLAEQLDEALRSGDSARVATAWAGLDQCFGDGGTDASRLRLDRCAADFAMFKELDWIDTLRWTAGDGRLPDPMAIATILAAAFHRFGIAAETAPADAARRINESVIRDRLLTGLDYWLIWTRSPAVLATLRAADPDPFRDAIRTAIQANDGGRIAELAARPEATTQPTRFVVGLAECRSLPIERRRAILMHALQQRPGDFAVLMLLGSLYSADAPDRTAEQVAWYRAAIALRPGNPTALINLGVALLQMGDAPGAIAAFREAIRLDPKNAPAHFHLGTAHAQLCPSDESIAAFRQAIRLDPGNPASHAGLGKVLRGRGDEDGAMACFREAARLDPKKYEPLLKPSPAVAPPPRPVKP